MLYCHRACGEIVAGIVSKCFNGKPKNKELAHELYLLCIECDKQEPAQEELIKGFESKQPKIIHASVEAYTKSLRLVSNNNLSLIWLMTEAFLK